MTRLVRFLPTTLIGAIFPTVIFAQQVPNTGEILQQQQQQQVLQPHREGPTVEVSDQAVPLSAPGGLQVTIAAISIGGGTVFTEEVLIAALGDVAGKRYDLAGLRALATRISAFYHNHGYLFARAFLPQQVISEGKLRIEVVEGKYGKVEATGDVSLTAGAARFLTALKTNDVISSAPLERATLILDDQPGIKVTSLVRPGQEVGTGDLDVHISRTPDVSGNISFDNHGNRYTGDHRAYMNLRWNSPVSFGDQITANLLSSDGAMWLGNVGYSRPLGPSGLRVNVGYSHTYYQLTKDFANLDATGTAAVSTLGVTYPIVRSQKANLTLVAAYQNKSINDKQRFAGTDDSKSSNSLPIAMNFDRRDSLWGGGTTYGSVSYTLGILELGSALEITDRISGQNTRGNFDKWNLDIARLQTTPFTQLNLYGRVIAQWAGKNMDSSEGFSLGGANGVRSYPIGEGSGDEGWLAQLEVRFSVGQSTLYVFHDSGWVALNANNGNLATPANPNFRSINGDGIGIRYSLSNWYLDANLSWRSDGGKPQSDTGDRNPRVWISGGYTF